MRKRNPQAKLEVVWEAIPNPEPHTVLKVVAMLFHRRVPLSTVTDLTLSDEELSCRRVTKH